MPKFHDEFFKKGSATHDELIYKILDDPKKIWDFYVNTRKTPDPEYVAVCNKSEENIFCTSDDPVAWRNKPICGKLYKNYLGECSITSKCQNLDEEKFLEIITTTTDPITPIYDILTAEKICVLVLEDISHETEKICKSNNSFIIGYSDVVFTFTYSTSINLKIKEGFIWREWKPKESFSIKIVVDAKPELKSWGGPLRQLKTYMDCLHAQYGILVSYDDIPEEHKQILEKENVGVIKIEKVETKNTLGDYFE